MPAAMGPFPPLPTGGPPPRHTVHRFAWDRAAPEAPANSGPPFAAAAARPVLTCYYNGARGPPAPQVAADRVLAEAPIALPGGAAPRPPAAAPGDLRDRISLALLREKSAARIRAGRPPSPAKSAARSRSPSRSSSSDSSESDDRHKRRKKGKHRHQKKRRKHHQRHRRKHQKGGGSASGSGGEQDDEEEVSDGPGCLLDVDFHMERARERVIPVDAGRQAVRALFAGDDISVELRQSLRCPITCRRPDVPAKGVHCLHARCFDLYPFLLLTAGQLKRGAAAWRCPVCMRALPADDLWVDAYWRTILAADPDADHVDLARDGSWSITAARPPPRDVVTIDD